MLAPVRAAIKAAHIDLSLAIVLVNVALYAICFQAQLPVQPYLLKSLSLSGDAAVAWGTFKSWGGALQVVGSLIAGLLVDKMGAKAVLLLSFVASAAAYYLTYIATDVTGLYVSQVPTVFQHAVLAARAYVAIASLPSDRTRHLGFIGLAYGVGVAVGPALGGFLSTRSLSLAAGAAAAGSLLSSLLVYAFVVPRGGASTSPTASSANVAAKDGPAKAPAASPWRVFQSRELLGLLAIKWLFTLAISLFHGVFSLVAAERFGLDASGVGLLLSFVGVVGILSQGFLAAPITERIGEDRVGAASAAVLVACFAAFAGISTASELYALCIPITVVSLAYMLVNTGVWGEFTRESVCARVCEHWGQICCAHAPYFSRCSRSSNHKTGARGVEGIRCCGRHGTWQPCSHGCPGSWRMAYFTVRLFLHWPLK